MTITHGESSAGPGRLPRAWSVAIEPCAWVVLSLLVVLCIFDVVRGPWDHDSGAFMLHAAFVARGMRPYLDYSSIYPPFMELLHGGFVALGFNLLGLVVVLPVLWNLANAGASFVLGRLLGCGRVAACLAAASFFMLSIENGGNHITLEHGIVFFSAVALILVLRSWPLTNTMLFGCGLTLAAAFLSKQNGLVAVAPVAAVLFERRREIGLRGLVALASGFAALVLAILAWLGFELSVIYHETVGSLLTYAQVSSRGLTSFRWEFDRSAPTLLFELLVATAGILAIVTGPRRLFAATSLAAAIAGFLPRLMRDHTHYTLNMWPFAIVVIILACQSRRDAVSRLMRAAGVAVFAGSLFALVMPQSLDRWSKPGLLRSTFVPAAETVRRISDESTPVRQYGAEPILEYLSERVPDRIKIPFSAYASDWNGSHMVGEPLPPPPVPVVFVDASIGWEPPMRRRLEQAGYEIMFDNRPLGNLRVTIYALPGSAPR